MSIFNLFRKRSSRQIASAIIDNYVFGNFGIKNHNDFSSLIDAYRNWVYTCATKNAFSVSSQNLRLYAVVPKNYKTLTPTKTITPEQKTYLLENHWQNIRKAQTANEFEIKEILDHPLLILLRNINPFYNQTDFFYLDTLFLELTGNSYWIKTDLNNLGQPQNLWIAPSQYIKVLPSKTQFIAGYEYDNYKGDPTTFKRNEIIHFKYPSPSSLYYGVSPLAKVSDSYNVDYYSHQYEEAVFKNLGIISGYFTTKENLGDHEFERLQEQLVQQTGVRNAGKMPLFDNGLEFQQTAVSPKDLLNAVVGKKSREEIAAAFGVPMSLLIVDNVNKANADAGYRAYMRDKIKPLLMFKSEKLNEQLVPLYDSKMFFAFDNPVKEDNENVRMDQEMMLKWGVATTNEIRLARNMPPLPDGDRRLVPTNYIYADMLEEFYSRTPQSQAPQGNATEDNRR